AKVFDTISNISTVLILRIERPMLRMIGRKIDEPYEFDKKTRKVNEIKWFITGMFFVLMIFFVIGTYIFRAVNTETVVMVGTLSVLFNYTNRIGGLFFRFTYRYGDFVRWRTNIANAEEISTQFTGARKRKKAVLGKEWEHVHVRNLQFQYEDEKSKKLHLDTVSFTLGRKERIAFIGASGSGKTTALKVIRELYPSKHVDLFVDDKNVDGGFSKISEQIALIPQDPEIFSTTIRENITLGLPVNQKKIRKYTDLAKFTEVVKRLPNGLKSTIHERGVNLSGGEKQRLALARGLLACEDKQIVLLDEPTSSVDPKNELEIYENVFATFKNKTIVSSIHRLHLLPLFDRIYLFHRGKIVASGSYDSLQQDSKLFCKMLDKYKQREVKGKK
ncbi:MAG: ATP-binding cassette domain-containing protein, partial [Nanobdellota archaeon]